ncbi:MAG: pilus assembly protein PilM [Deltaproteobacteria bacterium]|nr:pilus assembly protein PilM [Deltaproteobacteria bacterium]
MPQRFIGIDVGSYSVKVVEILATFRSYRVVAFHEERIRGGASEDVASTVARIVADHRLGGEGVVVGVRGDRASTRRLQFPFVDPRKIEAALPFQVEEAVPFEITDVVFDHFRMTSRREGSEVFVVVAPKKVIAETLRPFAGTPAEPRVITLAPLAFASLASQSLSGATEPIALIDVGHLTTDIVIIENGDFAFTRTLSRGGAHVTRAIAKALGVDEESAAGLKHDSLSIEERATLTDTEAILRRAALSAVAPLALDIKRTLLSYHAAGNAQVERILLVGGGSRIRGLDGHLAHELGTAVERFRPLAGTTDSIPHEAEVGDLACKALGLALRGVTGSKTPPINLRKDEFVLTANLDIVKERAGRIAASIIALVALLIFSLVSRGGLLSAKEDAQKGELKRITKVIFGKEIFEFSVALNQLGVGGPSDEQRMPEVSALDYWGDFAKYARARPESKIPVKLDVLSFAVGPRSIDVRGEIDSQEQLSEVEQNLKTHKCFTRVTIPESRKSGISDRIQFRISIEPGC